MKIRVFGFFLLWSLAVCSPALCDERYQLIALGDWHGEEVDAKNGDAWFGLLVTGGQAELVSGRILIENVHDIVMDNKDEEKSGKRIRFRQGEKTFSGGDEGAPLFLMRGKGLTPGVVQMSASAIGTQLYPGQSAYIDGTYSLIATGVGILGQYPAIVDIRDYCVRGVVNEKGGGYHQSEKLFCLDAVDHDAGVARAVFIGDLDRDSVPDFVLGGSDHYNVSAFHLFLSSPAKVSGDGSRWKKVAEFRTTGC